jgi:TolB-like protein
VASEPSPIPLEGGTSLAAAAYRALRFGAFTLLPDEHRLLRGEVAVPIGSRAFEVLHMLARRPGQLVTKDELLSAVWHGLVVEDSNLHVQVSQLRKAIGFEAIVTIAGLGYRFAHPVAEASAQTAPSATSTRRLSVIVLPFTETGVPTEQDYFADAITDDVTTQLSKIKGSTVIGSLTALAFKRQALDVVAIARDLGVRYVLQGRVERTGESVEVNTRLRSHAAPALRRGAGGGALRGCAVAADRGGDQPHAAAQRTPGRRAAGRVGAGPREQRTGFHRCGEPAAAGGGLRDDDRRRGAGAGAAAGAAGRSVSAGAFKQPFGLLCRAAVPFIAMMLGCLALVAWQPWIAMGLVR